ncbi:MAG: hypothetical protein V7606_4806 [Burkholderiales bacterium]
MSAEAAQEEQQRIDDPRLLEELKGIVGSMAVISDPVEMQPYLSDWRGSFSGAARCVVKPASTEETAAVVALCARHRIPMVPQGGNTGMCGGATPGKSGREIILNMSRMNKILDIDVRNNTLTVQAGCILQHIKDAADDADRLFPLALGAQGSCEIGGNLSTNAGGVNVLKYGNARSFVLGLEVVMPDGSVFDTLKGLRKDNSGYDLKHLFIGAEGTLGIITAAVLQLYPKARVSTTAWLAVDDPAAAVDVLGRLRGEIGERITCFELISRPMLELVLAHRPADRDPMKESHPWYVLKELSDTLQALDLGALLEQVLGKEIESGRVRDAVIANSLGQIETLWALRENVTEAQRAAGASVKHDISVSVSSIPDFLKQADEAVAADFPGARVIAFGHVGDGSIHYNVLQPAEGDAVEFKRRMHEVSRRIHDIAIRLGGSISAEHGLGQLKGSDVFGYKDPLQLRLMRAIKAAIDPFDLMNKGKIFPE